MGYSVLELKVGTEFYFKGKHYMIKEYTGDNLCNICDNCTFVNHVNKCTKFCCRSYDRHDNKNIYIKKIKSN